MSPRQEDLPNAARDAGSRILSTLRLLTHLASLADERELMDVLIQTAAMWYDVDARAYRRDLRGRFVLEQWLPGADTSLAPREFSAYAVVTGPEVIRISSTQELERLGWRELQGDLVLVPVVADTRKDPQWVIAIRDWPDAQVDPCFLVLCRMLGPLLEQLAVAQARAAQQRLLRWFVENDEAHDRRLPAALEELAGALSASHARLLVFPDRNAEPQTFARVGAEWPESVEPVRLDPGQSRLKPDRVSVAVALGPKARAVLDVLAPAGSIFTLTQARLVRASATMMGVWLSGSLKGGADLGRPAAQPFEQRIEQEVARAKQFGLGFGLVIVDAVGLGGGIAEQVALPDVARHLRGSDVVGELSGGQVGLLLVHTDSDGVTTTAERLERRFRELAGSAAWPAVALGKSVFPREGTSGAALIASAMNSLQTGRRRGPDMGSA